MTPFRGFWSLRAGVTALGLAFLALFLLYPLWLVLQSSVRDEATGAFTLTPFAQVLSSRYYLGSLRNSLVAAAMSMVFATLAGSLGAYFLETRR